MASWLAGVDGGGTRTRAAVTRGDLTVLGRGEAGPSNVSSAPVADAAAAVRAAVEAAAAAAGVDVASISRIAVGLAGAESDATRAKAQRALAEAFGGDRVLLTTDARIALAGAADDPVEGAAVVVIAGTGAIAFGRDGAGAHARAGGFGWLIGDEGSGAWIARRGLAAAARELDGRGRPTAIGAMLFETSGIRTAADLVAAVQRPGATPGDLAAFVPAVLRAARRGDAVALGILAEAADELALAAGSVIGQLGLAAAEFPVAASGGVFVGAAELLLDRFAAGVARVAPRARVSMAERPPEIGAIRLALAGAAP